MVYKAKGAVLEGRVTLGRDVNIWHNAVVRADINTIEIGDGTNIQDNCVLHVTHRHPMKIGKGCVVGHASLLHGCTLEDEVLVGMGAIVLDGAVIGKGSMIGAGALVLEGAVIPPGSLVVGSPARVLRQVSQEQTEHIWDAAIHYAEEAKKQLDVWEGHSE